MRSTPPRALVSAGLAIGSVVGIAGPAAAHVTLHSNDAIQGGSDAVVSIRVPNEGDRATTTGLEVVLPPDSPLIGVLAQPTPGWQVQVTSSRLAQPITTDDGTISDYVSTIVWSGGSIPVGGYQDFDIDVATLPKVATVKVKALQTYSNGDVVRWIDPPASSGQPAPDHPQPSLTLAPSTPASGAGVAPVTAAPATGATSAGPPAARTVAGPTVSSSDLAKRSEVNGARALSVVALVIGAIGAAAGLVALALATRRRPVT